MLTVFMIIFVSVNAGMINKRVQAHRYAERAAHPERWGDGMSSMKQEKVKSNRKYEGVFDAGVKP